MIRGFLINVGRRRAALAAVSLHDLGNSDRWWSVPATPGTNLTVDHGHAHARNIAELHAFEQRLAGGMLWPIHQNEVRGAPDFNKAAIEIAKTGRVSSRECESDLSRYFAER